MNITGNTVFIAGGTSGIGLALAVRLSEEGNKVIVGGRRKERLAEITNLYPELAAIEIDVDDSESIRGAFSEATVRYPELNVLVTMSGIMYPEDITDPTFVSVAERTVSTNLLGTIRLIGQFVPFLLTRPDAAIITVSSALAFVPLPITPSYNATKAAIHSFTESMRVQLAGTSIQVIEIAPPGVRTSLMNQEESEAAMPLDAFIEETVGLLKSDPSAKEIVVEAATGLRNAEANGNYDDILAALS